MNYFDFYHFLEGIIDYKNWEDQINQKSKHKRLKHEESDWCNVAKIEKVFERLITQFKESILVISYRSDGIASIERIKDILVQNGKKVDIHEGREIKYVLSNKQSSEVLIIGR